MLGFNGKYSVLGRKTITFSLCLSLCILGNFAINSSFATYYEYSDIYEAFGDITQLDRGYELKQSQIMDHEARIAREELSTQSPVFTLRGSSYGLTTNETYSDSSVFNIDNSAKTLNVLGIGHGSSGNIMKSGFNNMHGTVFNNNGVLNITSCAVNNNSLTVSGDTAIFWNKNTLNLNDVNFSNNTTSINNKGLIHNTSSGIITINNSYFVNNSGRYLINSSKTSNTLNINNSTFKDNQGIIYSLGTMNITSSSFSNGNERELYIKSGTVKITDTDFKNTSGIYITGGNLSVYAANKNVKINKINSDTSTLINLYATKKLTVSNIHGSFNINKTEGSNQYAGNVSLGGFGSEGAGKTINIYNGTVSINGYSTIGTLSLQGESTFIYTYTRPSSSSQDLRLENFSVSGNHTMNFQNDAIQEKIELADKDDDYSGYLTLNGSVSLNIDVDLVSASSDFFYTDTDSSRISLSGTFSVDDIKLMNPTSNKTTSIKVCNNALKNNFSLGVTSVSLDNNLYSISYQAKSDGGYLIFTREKNDVKDLSCVRTPECTSLGFTTKVSDIPSLGRTAICSPCPTNGSFFKCLNN